MLQWTWILVTCSAISKLEPLFIFNRILFLFSNHPKIETFFIRSLRNFVSFVWNLIIILFNSCQNRWFFFLFFLVHFPDFFQNLFFLFVSLSCYHSSLFFSMFPFSAFMLSNSIQKSWNNRSIVFPKYFQKWKILWIFKNKGANI